MSPNLRDAVWGITKNITLLAVSDVTETVTKKLIKDDTCYPVDFTWNVTEADVYRSINRELVDVK